jgi:hypothetical protein
MDIIIHNSGSKGYLEVTDRSFAIMRKIIPILILIIFTCDPAAGQSTFSANRPGQVDNPDITPPGNFMIETGFQYGKISGVVSYLLPTASVRYGINRNIEISLNADNIYQEENSLFGLTSNNIGSKIAICDEKGALPKISFVTAFILPFAGFKSMRPEHAGAVIQLAASHSIGSRATVYANAGATWSGNTSYPVYNYVATVYFSPARRFWTFAELYGFIPGEGDSSIASDFGVTWQAGDNFQLDLTAGLDLQDPGNNHFIQLGTAFQIVHRGRTGK